MQIKAVDKLCGNEVLAEPVLSDEQMILIPKGSQIKKEYIPLIASLGVESLMVEDPYEYLEKPNSIIDHSKTQHIINCVKQLMEKHIYHANKSLREFEIIANEIVKEINQMPEDTVIDMNSRVADLYEHTVMVTLLCVSVARQLKLERKRQYNIALGSLLHDLGIRYITTKYISRDWKKADPSDVFEYKKHTILGYSALDQESWIPDISKNMVLFHHERLDGSGFPMRRRNIDIECRIIQVCDEFDCCITGMECLRMSLQESFEKLRKDMIHKFDQKVVDSLIKKVARYPVGTIVKMDNHEKGIVISQTHDPEYPIILSETSNHEPKKYNLMLQKDVSILQIV